MNTQPRTLLTHLVAAGVWHCTMHQTVLPSHPCKTTNSGGLTNGSRLPTTWAAGFGDTQTVVGLPSLQEIRVAHEFCPTTYGAEFNHKRWVCWHTKSPLRQRLSCSSHSWCAPAGSDQSGSQGNAKGPLGCTNSMYTPVHPEGWASGGRPPCWEPYPDTYHSKLRSSRPADTWPGCQGWALPC